MNRAAFARALLTCTLLFVAAGCEKPCPEGYQRYGADCAKSPTKDAGVEAGTSIDNVMGKDSGPDDENDEKKDAGGDAGSNPDSNPEAGTPEAGMPAGVSCATVACDAVATCSDTTGQAICTCPSGYDDANGDGTECVDRDECMNGDAVCHPLASCTNKPGTFICQCQDGFNGDGINACEANKVCANAAGSNCDAQATCQKVNSIDYCVCNSGYLGDGEACTDINECAVANGDCGDAKFNKCTNNPGAPPKCEDINECLVDNGGCDSLTTCTNISPGRTCGACPAGYVGDGVSGCAPGLTGLLLSTGVLSPAFSTNVTSYSVILPITTQTITITPSAPFGATITVLGQAVASGQPWASPTLNLNDNTVSIVVGQPGRPSRTITVTVTRGKQQAYVKASNTDANDQFGASVAIHGNTMVVGAPGEDSDAKGVNGSQTNNNASGSGAAYVFVRDGSTWTQEAYLKASTPGLDDSFGRSVAIDGDTIVIGSPGEDSGSKGVNQNELNNDASGSGAAYVFTRAAGVWSQQAYLKPSTTAPGQGFGNDVAISGSLIVIGASQDNGSGLANAGAAYVFARSGNAWTQQARLQAFNPGQGDVFGGSVAIDGFTIVVGAGGEQGGATGVNGPDNDDRLYAGAAYVFVGNGAGVWTQQAYLKASNTGPDRFGRAVAISGHTVVVGAEGEASSATGVGGNQADDSAAGSGAAYVFTRFNTTWTQQAYLKASKTDTHDNFGCSVAVSGQMIVVGARHEDGAGTGLGSDEADNTANARGAAYVFARSGTSWSQQAYVKAQWPGSVDFFGVVVGISDGTIVVGASYEDSSAKGLNQPGGDGQAESAGAAYVFR